MGDVYVARDATLEREVALKVLPPELAASPERRARFEREAKSVAALNHPNIVTIHSVEDVDDVHFITMELVEGRTLGEVMPPRGFETAEFFAIATPLADAVNAAHEQGITHRDLKPSNVMVTREGRVKILDFGLAKVADVPTHTDSEGGTRLLTEQASDDLTDVGRIVGTVAYMSPEQASGDPADHRSDIFSLGIILYEMATGQRPFIGDSKMEVLSAILKDKPPNITDVRTKLPRHLGRIVGHCLEKDTERRYQSALDLRNDLEGLKDELETGEILESEARRAARHRWWARPAAILAGITAVLAILVAIWIVWRSPLLGFEQRDWVLIADFEREEHEAELSRALSLALNVGLQESDHVNVFSRSRVAGVLELMQAPLDAPIDESTGREVCQRAGVKGLLVPELSAVGDEYLLTIRVVDPLTGDTVASFAERAPGEDDLLDRLDALIQNLRRGLGESFQALRSNSMPLAQVTTGSLEALKRFSTGQMAWNTGRYAEAVRLYEEAVQLDPEFAFAHASLGSAYASFVIREVDKARASFDEALSRLDRVGHHERYFIQALYHGHFGSTDEAIQYYNLHLDRYPDDVAARGNLGNTYRDLGDCSRAIVEFRAVVDVDPRNASALVNSATCLGAVGEVEESINFYRRAFEVRPEWQISGNLNHEYGMTLVLAERFDEATEVFDQRLAHANAGERGGARRSLGQLALYRGHFSTAVEHFEEAAVLHSAAGSPASAGRDRLWQALAETVRGNVQPVEALLDQALIEVPLESGWIWLRANIGRAYSNAGLLDQAEAVVNDLEAWAALHEEVDYDRQSRLILEASVARARSRPVEAIEILEPLRAVELRPNENLAAELAQAYLVAERWTDSAEALASMVDAQVIFYEGLIPWVLAHYELAEVLERLDRPEEAAPYYSRFVELWGETDSPLPLIARARDRLSVIGAP
jgi:tetratricopeptide (TPR) repeat protein